jgi:nitroreductase
MVKMNCKTMKNTEFQLSVSELMCMRRTVLPKRLVLPGPDSIQLQALLAAASTGPDHDLLSPWRLVLIPDEHRQSLGQIFAEALRERETNISMERMSLCQEKAQRAPMLLLLIVDFEKGDQKIDLMERLISAGCALQNMLLLATAMGYGSALTSGKALRSKALREGFGLKEGEQAVCFLSIGTEIAQAPEKPRKKTLEFFSVWTSRALDSQSTT